MMCCRQTVPVEHTDKFQDKFSGLELYNWLGKSKNCLLLSYYCMSVLVRSRITASHFVIKRIITPFNFFSIRI